MLAALLLKHRHPLVLAQQVCVTAVTTTDEQAQDGLKAFVVAVRNRAMIRNDDIEDRRVLAVGPGLCSTTRFTDQMFFKKRSPRDPRVLLCCMQLHPVHQG